MNQDHVNLSVQLTRKYAAGWSHLDKWHDIGRARLVRSGKVRQEFECERYLQIWDVEAPGYRSSNVARALTDTLTFGCCCDHDCCGHKFGGPIKVRRLRDGTYAVLISTSRNV